MFDIVDGQLMIPTDRMCASSKSRTEAQSAFSFNEDEMCIENNSSMVEDGQPIAPKIKNEESGESKHSFPNVFLILMSTIFLI